MHENPPLYLLSLVFNQLGWLDGQADLAFPPLSSMFETVHGLFLSSAVANPVQARAAWPHQQAPLNLGARPTIRLCGLGKRSRYNRPTISDQVKGKQKKQ